MTITVVTIRSVAQHLVSSGFQDTNQVAALMDDMLLDLRTKMFVCVTTDSRGNTLVQEVSREEAFEIVKRLS